MKNRSNTKRIISFILVIVSFFVCSFSNNTGSLPVVNASETRPVIKAEVNGTFFKKGDVISVKFYFDNFAQCDLKLTTFQLDVPLDTSLFEFVSGTCHLDATDTLAAVTHHNTKENIIKTVYLNMKQGGYLAKDSRDICTIELKLIKDLGTESRLYTLPVSQLVFMDATVTPAVSYDCDVFEPSFTITGSSVVEDITVSPAPTAPVTETPAPTEKPSSTATDVPSQTYVPVVTDPPTTVPTPVVTETPSHTVNPSASALPENSDLPENSTPSAETKPPVTEQPPVPEYTVTYVDEAGRVFHHEVVKAGKKALREIEPNRLGYEFTGWSVSSGDLDAVNENITAVAMFEPLEIKYTIKVTGGVLQDGNDSSSYFYDECVIIEVDEKSIPEGKVFAGWSKSGNEEIISYSKTYSFLVTGSENISAVYSDVEVEAKPTVVLEALDVGYFAFVAERNCPEGFSYVSSGMIFTEDSAVAFDEGAFIKGKDGIVEIKSNALDPKGKLTVAKSDNIYGEIYAKAYLEYKDGDGNTYIIYSDLKGSF